MKLRRRLLLGAVAIALFAGATFALGYGLAYDYRLQLRSPPTSGPLDGQRLVASQVTGHRLVPGTELTIGFEDGTVYVDAGCNSIDAGYAVRAGRLRTPEVSQTMMACSRPGWEEQDDWASGFLDGARVDQQGDRLLLRNHETTITLIPRLNSELPDAIVEDWNLIGLRDAGNSRGLDPLPRRAERAMLSLSDRVAATSSGCDARFSANIRHEPATVIFETTTDPWQRHTRRRCLATDARVDAALRAALRGRTAVKRNGNQLTLTGGRTVLRFKRASS